MAGYKQIKLLIVEDEWVISRYLRDIIESHFDSIIVCEETKSVADTVSAIHRHSPKIVLMDIELTDGSCFDVLDQTRHLPFQKIFITSYSEHALKAIKTHAVDYHLKPINEKDLVRSVERCIENIEHEEIVKLSQQRSATAAKAQKKEDENFLVVNKKTEKILIEYSRIVYVMSHNTYTTVFYLSKKQVESVRTSISMKRMEDMLPVRHFFRIHNRYIVNTNYIDSVNSSSAMLQYDITIPVNAEKAKLFKTRIA